MPHDRPSGYSFLPELAACPADQISIQTAQSGLDCAVDLADPGKTIILGVLDLNDVAVETPAVIAERVRPCPMFRRSGSCSRLTAAWSTCRLGIRHADRVGTRGGAAARSQF